MTVELCCLTSEKGFLVPTNPHCGAVRSQDQVDEMYRVRPVWDAWLGVGVPLEGLGLAGCKLNGEGLDHDVSREPSDIVWNGKH